MNDDEIDKQMAKFSAQVNQLMWMGFTVFVMLLICLLSPSRW